MICPRDSLSGLSRSYRRHLTSTFLLASQARIALGIDPVRSITDLVGSADWVKYVTTGGILLAAVTLDTVARRRQAAAGR